MNGNPAQFPDDADGLVGLVPAIEGDVGSGASSQRRRIDILPFTNRRTFGLPTKLVAGLRWRTPLTEGGRSMSPREMADTDTLRADFFTVRNLQFSSQYGFGWRANSTVSIKMLEVWESAAAAMAAAVRELKWIGVWEFEEIGQAARWWFVGVNDFEILADGDSIYDSREKAQSRLLRERALLGSDVVVFAPAAWELAGSRHDHWQALLSGVHGSLISENRTAKAKLKQMSVAGIAIAAVCALSYALPAGYSVAVSYLSPPKPVSLPVTAAATTALTAAPSFTAVETPAVRSRQTMTPPPAFIGACIAALGVVTKAVPGWDTSALSCNQTEASVSYSVQTGGRRSYLVQLMGDKLRCPDDTHCAAVTPLALSGVVDVTSEPDKRAAADWIHSLGDRPGIALDSQHSASNAGPWQGGVRMPFAITSTVSPKQLQKLFGSMQSVEITSMATTINQGSLGAWHIEGQVYANQ